MKKEQWFESYQEQDVIYSSKTFRRARESTQLVSYSIGVGDIAAGA
jgi:hypothetical protein